MLGEFKCVAVPGTSTLVISQTFDASRAEVFEAWTTPEEVALWWDPTGVPLALCEIDLRPGGTFRWIHRGDVGVKHQFSGTYREIVPPERLVFEARISPAHPLQVATLIFTEDGEATTLTMTIQCASVAARDEMLAMRIDAGTAKTLENLAAYLKRAT